MTLILADGRQTYLKQRRLVTLTKQYEPYGEERFSTGPGRTAYGYTGEWASSSTNLLYLRARYYQSSTGQFLTKDTWDGEKITPMSYNSLLYIYANPVNFTDPTGHDAYCDANPQTCGQMKSKEIDSEIPFKQGKQKYQFAVDARIAYQGISFLDDINDAWWEKDLGVLELLQMYIRREFGVHYMQKTQVREAFTRRFWTFCTKDNPWSGYCLYGFWGYGEPIRKSNSDINLQVFKELGSSADKPIIREYEKKVLNPDDPTWKRGKSEYSPYAWATVNDVQYQYYPVLARLC